MWKGGWLGGGGALIGIHRYDLGVVYSRVLHSLKLSFNMGRCLCKFCFPFERCKLFAVPSTRALP